MSFLTEEGKLYVERNKLSNEQEERLMALTLALQKRTGVDGDSPRWVVSTAETFRKYIATGELQG